MTCARSREAGGANRHTGAGPAAALAAHTHGVALLIDAVVAARQINTKCRRGSVPTAIVDLHTIVPTRNMHKMAAVRIEPIDAVAIAFIRDAGRWEPPAPLGDHVVVVLRTTIQSDAKLSAHQDVQLRWIPAQPPSTSRIASIVNCRFIFPLLSVAMQTRLPVVLMDDKTSVTRRSRAAGSDGILILP